MSEPNPPCPKCSSEYSYQDGNLWICPECAYEWTTEQAAESSPPNTDDTKIFDSNGNELKDGDSVTIVKTLKVKGATAPLKAGTKVKNIRLNPGAKDGHDISCKIDGFGAMNLKSEVVKKS